jgi:hypothetical protein
MSVSQTAFASWLMAAAPLLAAVSAHTTFALRLLTPVSSYYSKPGDEVRGVVVGSVCSQSGSFLPAGTIVRGTVKSVHRVGLGIIHETAKINLQFLEAELPESGTEPIAARLTSVDNARERVDDKGAIRGIRATATLSNRVGERLALATMGHPIALVPILVAESLLFRFPDPEIDYRPGTDLHLELESALSLPQGSGCGDSMGPVDPSPELQEIVDRLPYWTYTQRQHKAMDPTNLMFVGSEEELDRAFDAAGWSGARSFSAAADLGVMRAIAENHADSDGPMRTLLLENRAPEISRQKTLNTFDKRHHIRIWRRTEKLDGASVWAAAATWDISTTFSVRYGFTHRVQNDTDLERDKVAGDLAFTGCVDQMRYINRPTDPDITEGAGRNELWSDGRIAVVVLNACVPQQPGPAVRYGRPPRTVRYVRRFTLTIRNHFLRDNLVWRGGEGIYLTYRALRGWRQQRIAGQMTPAERALRSSNTPAGGGSELNGALGLLLGL